MTMIYTLASSLQNQTVFNILAKPFICPVFFEVKFVISERSRRHSPVQSFPSQTVYKPHTQLVISAAIIDTTAGTLQKLSQDYSDKCDAATKASLLSSASNFC